MSYIASKS